ncbi:NAD(P)-dependent alcohol dehydrogenase [Saccharomonospora sp. NPDC046836]|uniref:NAD(P)-dependent alcohol dehydrogenase n=1 Tax=Saccharomonospora sp. NPDC046836 TaxID=3156921 RepID=UPI0033F666DC
MPTVRARATAGPHQPFEPATIDRREPGPRDVVIDIAYAGICHSDIHHAHNDYGKTRFPLVPGHEIAGTVAGVGADVTAFAVGDRAGVGCMIESCGRCDHCRAGRQQFCVEGYTPTAAGVDRAGRITQGGYSRSIVVDETFVLRIPDALPLRNAAPLLCAGITLYSPLRHWQAGPGKRIALLGFGGLGHIGVQLSSALGAHTTVLDLSLDKRDDGLRLGADDYVATTNDSLFTDLASSFDLILCTVPVNLDLDRYLGLLAANGTWVNIGVPEKPFTISPFTLLRNRRSMAASLIGGVTETQEMLDFCAEHGIGAEVEVIDGDRIDEAYERVLRGDVRYRFVLDATTL